MTTKGFGRRWGARVCRTSGARYGKLCIWKRRVAVSVLAVLKQVPRSAMTTTTGEAPAPASQQQVSRATRERFQQRVTSRVACRLRGTEDHGVITRRAG